MTFLKKLASSGLSVLALSAGVFLAPTETRADSQPFVGEISAMGIYGFCPRGFAEANGQLLSVNQNDALFSLLGTTFGGDGRTTFGLPDFRGRTPMGVGSGPGLTPRQWGVRGGAERVTLTQSQLAPHSHTVRANNLDGDKPGPGSKLLAAAPPSGVGSETIYSDQPANVDMSANMIAPTGGGQSMTVIDPTEVIRYCIALVGIYPSRH